MRRGAAPRYSIAGLDVVHSLQRIISVAAFLAPLGQAAGQTVTGTVTDAQSGHPVAGTMVSLYAEGGGIPGWSMAGEDGRFEVAAPGPGSYRVGMHVVGRTLSVSDWFAVDGQAPTLFLDLHFDGRPVELTPAQAGAETRCEISPGGAMPVGMAWHEVEKALANLLWARQEGPYAYQLSMYQRRRSTRDPTRVLHEERSPLADFAVPSFDQWPSQAQDSAVPDSLGAVVSGVMPDPSLLTSRWFKDRYCVGLVPSPAGPGTVALALSSATAGSVTELQGLLILDQATAAVTSFHYWFPRGPRSSASSWEGGWMTFERLDEGPFFISAWERRLPGGTGVVPWTFEEGGYALSARTEEGDVVWRADPEATRVSFADSLWMMSREFSPSDLYADRDAAVFVDALDTEGSGGYVRVLGRVVGRESRAPIAGAVVRLDGAELLTDEEGRFVMDGVRAGRQTIEVGALGRKTAVSTLVLDSAAAFNVSVVLSEDPIELQPLVVEVERRSQVLDWAGFYDRRDRWHVHGARLTREDIEENPSPRMADHLFNIPGTRIERSGLGAVMNITRYGNLCSPITYVDGVRKGRGYDLNTFPPDVIEGVEVYVGQRAPIQFQSDACGVVLFWTRH